MDGAVTATARGSNILGRVRSVQAPVRYEVRRTVDVPKHQRDGGARADPAEPAVNRK